MKYRVKLDSNRGVPDESGVPDTSGAGADLAGGSSGFSEASGVSGATGEVSLPLLPAQANNSNKPDINIIKTKTLFIIFTCTNFSVFTISHSNYRSKVNATQTLALCLA